MRIKFEKGITPESMAQAFIDFVRQNNLVIGSVNMYIQTYDENMKAEKYRRDDEYTLCKPTAIAKEEYIEDVALTRRSRLKAVGE